MQKTHAVGIDLGTTYSCISYLNEHGEPVTIPNQEGELTTPSAVMFEDNHEVIVGTEALRNSIAYPERVVLNAKRFMGNARKVWTVEGRKFTPVDISSLILKKLISAAQEQIGPISEAVITVPAGFSDFQRHATVEAGHRAGLERVDIINEPVAAALCYVLGTEGMWFSELAAAQRIMVYDLGGGTFDLSLVSYEKNEVRVIAAAGDLELGGIDWTRQLADVIARQFNKEFKADPTDDPQSLQHLMIEAEQAKRSLTVRPKAALNCQHGGHRKTYQIEQTQFEKICRGLVDRTAEITKRMLKDHKMGWAHVDVVLTTGGSSRMPMIRSKLQQISGRTLNTALSPDQSIAHGATYYAGMLLTNNKFARSILNDEASQRLAKVKQSSVNARSLGILVRDVATGKRFPHYLIPANSMLPVTVNHDFGTVVPNQKRVNVQIVESGTDESAPVARLGNCVIDQLPDDLPEGSRIQVSIHYDEQARVHVSAREVASGKEASTEILRHENMANQLEADPPAKQSEDFSLNQPRSAKPKSASPVAAKKPVASSKPTADSKPPTAKPAAAPAQSATPAAAKPRKPAVARAPAAKPPAVKKPKPREMPAPKPRASLSRRPGEIDDAVQPVPLCDLCGDPLNSAGECGACGSRVPAAPAAPKRKKRPRPAAAKPAVPRPAPPLNDDDILDLSETSGAESAAPKRTPVAAKPRRSSQAAAKSRTPQSKRPAPDKKTRQVPPRGESTKTGKSQSASRPTSSQSDSGEEEFWNLTD